MRIRRAREGSRSSNRILKTFFLWNKKQAGYLWKSPGHPAYFISDIKVPAPHQVSNGYSEVSVTDFHNARTAGHGLCAACRDTEQESSLPGAREWATDNRIISLFRITQIFCGWLYYNTAFFRNQGWITMHMQITVQCWDTKIWKKIKRERQIWHGAGEAKEPSGSFDSLVFA